MAKPQTPDKAGEAPSNESYIRLESTAKIVSDWCAAGRKLPLQVMLEVMEDQYNAGNKVGAVAIANQAAPYVHPKLRDVVITGGSDEDNPVRIELGKGMKKLSMKELTQLEALLNKASDKDQR